MGRPLGKAPPLCRCLICNRRRRCWYEEHMGDERPLTILRPHCQLHWVRRDPPPGRVASPGRDLPPGRDLGDKPPGRDPPPGRVASPGRDPPPGREPGKEFRWRCPRWVDELSRLQLQRRRRRQLWRRQLWRRQLWRWRRRRRRRRWRWWLQIPRRRGCCPKTCEQKRPIIYTPKIGGGGILGEWV